MDELLPIADGCIEADLTIEMGINFRHGSYGRFKRITQKYYTTAWFDFHDDDGSLHAEYRVYLALVDSGAAITPDECRSMSMAELRGLMQEQGDGSHGDKRKHRNRQGGEASSG